MDPITKRLLIRNIVIQSIIYIIIGILITIGVLFFSGSFDIIAWVNGLFLAGSLLIAFSWMFVISNANLFTPLIYGVKSFFTYLIGRKMEKDLVEYTASRKTYGKEFILVPLIVGVLYIAVAVMIWTIYSS